MFEAVGNNAPAVDTLEAFFILPSVAQLVERLPCKQ